MRSVSREHNHAEGSHICFTGKSTTCVVRIKNLNTKEDGEWVADDSHNENCNNFI